MEKETAIATVVAQIQAFKKEQALKNEVSEEVADAYAVIERSQLIAVVTDMYNAFNDAGLLK